MPSYLKFKTAMSNKPKSVGFQNNEQQQSQIQQHYQQQPYQQQQKSNKSSNKSNRSSKKSSNRNFRLSKKDIKKSNKFLKYFRRKKTQKERNSNTYKDRELKVRLNKNKIQNVEIYNIAKLEEKITELGKYKDNIKIVINSRFTYISNLLTTITMTFFKNGILEEQLYQIQDILNDTITNLNTINNENIANIKYELEIFILFIINLIELLKQKFIDIYLFQNIIYFLNNDSTKLKSVSKELYSMKIDDLNNLKLIDPNIILNCYSHNKYTNKALFIQKIINTIRNHKSKKPLIETINEELSLLNSTNSNLVSVDDNIYNTAVQYNKPGTPKNIINNNQLSSKSSRDWAEYLYSLKNFGVKNSDKYFGVPLME